GRRPIRSRPRSGETSDERTNPRCFPRAVLCRAPVIRGRRSCEGQYVAQLAARGDVELRVDLVQVPFDRSRADEQLGTDLGVRPPLACESGDLRLLCGEDLVHIGCLLAHRLACCLELTAGTLR